MSGKIRLGVCAMAKKIDSKPMKAILERITASGLFEVIQFPEETIKEELIEEWPQPIDFLISFFSDGFPLEKAEAYVELRKPHLINDLTSQHLLLDRRRVYGLLEENGIPCPSAIAVERDPETGLLIGDAAEGFVEAEDYIMVGSRKLEKPFVEKPMDAEDHNICIYYPSSAGGGVKNLFRKVGNKSSEYDKTSSKIRKDGSYMYESFFQTGGIDIKVYTVGPDYAHAEARKSPVVDGSVNRDVNGKEVRTPVVLTPTEKEIARRVSTAFGQMVCGFDMLRTPTKSYVIDVNGWSFVKGVDKYYEDASSMLMQHMLRVMGKSSNFVPVSRASPSSLAKAQKINSSNSVGSLGRWDNQELLAVLAIMRHGDRTPKNKMKLLTERNEFKTLHEHWAKGPKSEAKLKSPEQLQEVLDLVDSMLSGIDHPFGGRSPGHESGSEDTIDTDIACPQPCLRRCPSLDDNTFESLRLLREVLSEGDQFSGIYRKVQLKPTKWDEDDKVKELMIILKYGGTLTPAGRAQAEKLGHRFRREMYPGERDETVPVPVGANPREAGGLLRLHATQRHDFKAYSSDEGRVQMSAAAFIKSLLNLEGEELTPICVALVERAPAMLDDLPADAEALMKEAKAKLHERILGTQNDASGSTALGVRDIEVLYGCICKLCEELEGLDLNKIESLKCCHGTGGRNICCSVTKPLLVLKRWQKLREDLRSKKGTWDISKLTEVYDAVKFDMIHNQGMAQGFEVVFAAAKTLNDFIVPLEYGDDPESRSQIGAKVCRKLAKKLRDDLNNSVQQDSTSSALPAWSLVTASQFLKRMFVKAEDPDLTRHKSDAHEAENEASFASHNPDFAEHLKNPTRRVRTRLYFTSESHIQSMMNVLRCCQHADGDGVVAEDVEAKLCADPVFDYLSQIVFRLYEDKMADAGSDERYRVEILFSPGANDHPSAGHCHTMPLKDLQPLHSSATPLTLKRLQKLLEPYANGLATS